jgi:hypothetical protein
MKIGKLYKNIDPIFFWFGYPTKEKAGYMAQRCLRISDGVNGAGGNFDSTKMAEGMVKGLINRFNYQVFMVPPASIFVLLEHDETTFGNREDGYGTTYKILTERGEVGWIYVEEYRITNLQLIGD